ncbi:MAG TPA: oligopeptide/dipeptide ABC transporter ATP-binding protein [Rhodopila sp.]|jgi:oligopeptide transport system ATP-binding protein|nr:oligopeptide/dipeptide ABC transporter ATP-binding protein [Rhodopila sp.]
MADTPPLLSVDGLTKHYQLESGHTLKAVEGVSFQIGHGETLGLVGESGCGKSTVGKTVLRLVEPSRGSVQLEGVEITKLSYAALREQRRSMQVIFQDPYASLNPKMKAGAIVAEPFVNYGLLKPAERSERVAELFAKVGLRPDQMDRYPHEFSGGQRQRLGIARALALEPKLVIGDEPVSALDVSVQAQVINLMVRLQEELGLGYLFIAHDLAVVRHISDRVAVMYLGRIVEVAKTEALFHTPAHPYTRMLLASVPSADARRGDRRRTVLRGEPPSPLKPPSGCPFHTRCPDAVERCRVELPVLRPVGTGHTAACHLVGA